jgi:DNA polymerase-3 subunit delta'
MSEEDIEEPAGEGEGPELPPPRENAELVGHSAAESLLLSAFNSERLPHAWLIAGPKGVGKATLAYRFARFLLAEPPTGGLFGAAPKADSLAIAPEHPVFRLVASGAHPDLLAVERGWDPKRKRLRSEIVVDDTRAIADFLHLTASQGGWRVVIVDGADDMNRNAANALLKVLEEPPKRSVLLLTSESPGRLLPTIRSRCRLLHLKKLSETVVSEAIMRQSPELAPADALALALLAEGSIGRALMLAAMDGLSIHRDMYRLLGEIPKIDTESLYGFAERLARNEGQGFRLLAELLPGALTRMIELALGQGAGSPPSERETLARLASRRGLDQWVEVWRKICHLFAAAEGIELDRKQVVLNAFFALEEAAR